jgi:hypothetical protein
MQIRRGMQDLQRAMDRALKESDDGMRSNWVHMGIQAAAGVEIPHARLHARWKNVELQETRLR